RSSPRTRPVAASNGPGRSVRIRRWRSTKAVAAQTTPRISSARPSKRSEVRGRSEVKVRGQRSGDAELRDLRAARRTGRRHPFAVIVHVDAAALWTLNPADFRDVPGLRLM